MRTDDRTKAMMAVVMVMKFTAMRRIRMIRTMMVMPVVFMLMMFSHQTSVLCGDVLQTKWFIWFILFTGAACVLSA